jgi:prevent-host-death family protein
MATVMPVSELRTKAGHILSRIKRTGERFIIQRRGEPVAVLMGIEEYRRLTGEEPTKKLIEEMTREELVKLAKAARGMWKDRDDIGDALDYIERSRAGLAERDRFIENAQR